MPVHGYFDRDSLLREVVSHRLTALSGPRALLVMAAHPVAFAGFFAHTGALDDPYARLRRTGDVLDAIAFGTKEDADRATRRVRAIHRRIAGELEDGRTYRADDPDLLLWILAAMAESALVVYPRYVRRLSHDERNALWRDYRIVGRCFGLRERDMPRTVADFDAYMARMYGSGDLVVTDAARGLAQEIVMRPPVPLYLRPLRELVNQITISLLPDSLRRQYGFSWDPVRSAAHRGGAEYVRRIVLPALSLRGAS